MVESIHPWIWTSRFNPNTYVLRCDVPYKLIVRRIRVIVIILARFWLLLLVLARFWLLLLVLARFLLLLLLLVLRRLLRGQQIL